MSNAKHARRRFAPLQLGKLTKTVAVVATVLAVGISPTAASAKDVDTARAAAVVQPSANTVGTTQICDRCIGSGDYGLKSIYGSALRDNTVPWLALGSQLRAEIRAAQQKADAAKTQATNADNKAQDALERPDYGTLTEPTALDSKVIENLGGKYFGDTTATGDDRYTVLGTFSLTKGKWLVNTAVQFHRNAAGVAGTRPQVGLRIGQDQTLTGDAVWGRTLGTISGAEISPASGRDLFGSAVGSITLTETTTVTVYGFGYNDSQGTEGSGQIAAQVTVNPLRVG